MMHSIKATKHNFYISKVQPMHVMQISGLASTILHILEGIKSLADLIVQKDRSAA